MAKKPTKKKKNEPRWVQKEAKKYHKKNEKESMSFAKKHGTAKDLKQIKKMKKKIPRV